MSSRREFLKISGSVALALGTCQTFAHVARGGGGAAGGGFPNAAPAFIPMRQVYPAPSGVASYESHLVAYYKPSTGDTFEWRKRIGVSFGRWPYTYSLVSGPPGMAFGATTWNTAWDGNPAAAYAAGYGQLRWTPNAAISSGSPTTISVDVTDQDGNLLNVQWPIYTTDDVANGGVFAFLNADTGNDTTGNGSKATPWQTIPHAIGTVAGSGGAAPAGSVLIMRGATALYTFPANQSGGCTTNANQPASFIGYPGETATVDLSGMAIVGGQGCVSPDVAGNFFQDFTLSGYDASAANICAFKWSTTKRVTFQGIIWNNSGFGTSAANNASLIYTTGGGLSMGDYLFITGCQDNNRQSSNAANNSPVCLLYNYNEVLTELCTSNSPTSLVGHSLFFKSDINYGCLRANFAYHSGGGGFFDPLQSGYSAFNYNECCYNVGINIGHVALPDTAPFTYGNNIAYRNSFIAAAGFISNQSSYNLTAPFINGHAPAGYSITASSTSTTGGTLAANNWAYVISTKGVTGESGQANGIGGTEILLTSTGTTSANTLVWADMPLNSGYRIWRGNAGTGSENQYLDLAADTTTFVDDGSHAWTSGTLPSSSNACSSARFTMNSNAVQTSAGSQPPTGAVMQDDGKNQFVASGMLDTTTGLFTSTYRAANPSLMGYLGAPLS